MTRFKLGLAVACSLLILATQVSADPLVVNGDFESDTSGFVVWPGYVNGTDGTNTNPADISGWTGGGGRGINPVTSQDDNPAPFRDNGNNDTTVAFLQGAAHIEQMISGFAVGNEYTLSLDFNSRNCCGDFPVGTVLLNGEVVASSADLFPDPGAVPPVGDGNDWYHADIDFTAPTADITLRVESVASAGGDATLVLDNISIVPEPSAGLLLLLGMFFMVTKRRRRA